ncbi:Copper type II ascorbate-dependent monooxygenase C-terminal [Trinorchestia longiramus]|nr:Copper type II ascorbate-dependent monooxygenase C-terminal [Trinorchestia longiramus]
MLPQGGFSAADEMCLVYLTYYPRMPLSDCYSKPHLTSFLRALGVQQLYNEEEFKRAPFGDAFSPDMIDHELEERLRKLMGESASAGVRSMDVSMSWYLHKMKIQLPQSHQNKSVLELLYEDSLWEDEVLTQALQEMYTQGHYYVGCLTSGRTALSQVPSEDVVPTFVPYKINADSCVSANVDDASDVHLSGSGGYSARQKNDGVSSVSSFLTVAVLSVLVTAAV